MKILVRAPNWIGDQIQAYPFFHALRARYPQAEIVSVCVSWVASIQFRTCVDRSHVLPPMKGLGAWQKFRILENASAALREQGPWDLGISLPNSLSAAWLIYRSGCASRRGYALEGRGIMLNDARNWRLAQGKRRFLTYLDLAAAKGEPSSGPGDLFLQTSENAQPIRGQAFDAVAEWHPDETLEIAAEDYWVLAPGAKDENRQWPLAYFRVLAQKIAAATGMRGYIVGSAAEIPLARQMCADHATKLVDKCGQVALPGLWKIFREARFCVANDSGLAHFSALMGCPTFIPWGAGDPRHTMPHGPGHVSLLLNPVTAQCWPCEQNDCTQPPDAQLQCITGVLPDAVYHEIRKTVRGLFRDG